jgi:hypothetical protein
MAAKRDMQIKLDTNLGAISLEISAECEGNEKIGKAAMQYAVFHQVPATAFKKGSGFKRDSAYSEDLRDIVAEAVELRLKAAGFDAISVKASKHIAAPSANRRAIKQAKAEARRWRPSPQPRLLFSAFESNRRRH